MRRDRETRDESIEAMRREILAYLEEYCRDLSLRDAGRLYRDALAAVEVPRAS